MTPSERSDCAKRWLEDPLFRETLADMREQIVRKLESSTVESDEAEHERVLSLKALKLMETMLKIYAAEAEVEKSKAEQVAFMERTRSLARAWFG